MRSSRIGRYILFAVAVAIALGGWMALKATEKQLRRMRADRVAPAGLPARPARLSAPRATGPLANGADATPGRSSGPSGPSGATGDEAAPSAPPSESDPRSGIPAGAIW